ncbi:MAG TPA: response regulator [Candidatus Saccharimonadales bacterium]|nr:response regulator [Candidatus Saccharimonadales bacterium]
MNSPVNADFRIAVIEDEPAIRELYQTKFGLEGFKVATATNGIEGLELAERWQPHVLLLDIRMPEMNGDEMLLKLRGEDWGADMRVVVLTNISRDEAPSVLRFLAVDRYVVKAHYTPTQVVDVVRDVLHIK